MRSTLGHIDILIYIGGAYSSYLDRTLFSQLQNQVIAYLYIFHAHSSIFSNKNQINYCFYTSLYAFVKLLKFPTLNVDIFDMIDYAYC